VLHTPPLVNLPEFIPASTKSGAIGIWWTESFSSVRPLSSLMDPRISLKETKLKEFGFQLSLLQCPFIKKRNSFKGEIHSFNRDISVQGMIAIGQNLPDLAISAYPV
jgi:hypothetical protein